MSEAHDRQHAPNMLGVSNATPHVLWATMLLYISDRQDLCSHGNSSKKALQCKHKGGREVCITSVLLVDDTFTSVSVGCAAVVAVIAAAAVAAVKLTLQYVGHNAR